MARAQRDGDRPGAAGDRSLIRSRLSQSGEVGYLVVDGVALADGRVVAVLQGWVPDPESAPELAGRQIEVDGRVQPYENFYAGAPVTADDPLLTISAAGLAEQWRQAPVDGYVTVTGPPAAAGLGGVTPLVGTDPDVPFPLAERVLQPAVADLRRHRRVRVGPVLPRGRPRGA